MGDSTITWVVLLNLGRDRLPKLWDSRASGVFTTGTPGKRRRRHQNDALCAHEWRRMSSDDRQGVQSQIKTLPMDFGA